MSKFTVQTVIVDNIKPHAQADSLSVAYIGGWSVVVAKDSIKNDDVCLYIPMSAKVPVSFSDKYGFTKYLNNGVVRGIRLHGVPSYGILLKDKESFGDVPNVHFTASLGITKYISANKFVVDDIDQINPDFREYADIQNIRNCGINKQADAFKEGEIVICTEKIDGTHSRIGLLCDINDVLTLSAGSYDKQKKIPYLKNGTVDFGACSESPYLYPLTIPGIVDMLRSMKPIERVVLYGEVYGEKVKGSNAIYDAPPNKLAYRALDMTVDDGYLDYDYFEKVCKQYGIPTAPVIFRGEYTKNTLNILNSSKSVLCNPILEGVVMRPVKERYDTKSCTRCIFSYQTDNYLLQ